MGRNQKNRADEREFGEGVNQGNSHFDGPGDELGLEDHPR